MGAYYDEIEIEDMTYDPLKRLYHYPCPCGDRFEITRAQLRGCEDIAVCPSCSLVVRVVYDPLDYEDEEEEDDDSTEGDEDEDGDGFEDALENLSLSDEKTAVIAPLDDA